MSDLDSIHQQAAILRFNLHAIRNSDRPGDVSMAERLADNLLEMIERAKSGRFFMAEGLLAELPGERDTVH